MTLPSVLLIGVDSPTGLAIMRELGKHGVPVHGVGTDERGIGAFSRYCSRFWKRGEGKLIEWLPGMIAASGALVVMAWSENDLMALSALPEIIAGAAVLTPRRKQLERVLDKAETLRLADELGIETPRDWGEEPKKWPVVVKWPAPMRVIPNLRANNLEFIKAEYCNSPQELAAVLDRYAAIDERPLVQSYAKGRGIGQMFHMQGGQATLFFQHERVHEWPPEGGVSTYCRAVALSDHQAQRAKSEALLSAIGWEGPAMVEYRWNPETDEYNLMEINGRFWGSQPLASHAGAQFGWEVYRCNILHDKSAAPPYQVNVEARYMIPETKRLVRLLGGRNKIADPYFKPTPWKDIANFLKGFFNPHMRYYVFSWSDPRPFFADCANIFRKTVRRDKQQSTQSMHGQCEKSSFYKNPPIV